MKLRLRDNALRLRLTQREVEQIGRGESVAGQTPFPNATFTYRLAVIADQQPTVTLEHNCLTVGLPAVQARAWAGSDQVAIQAQIDTGQSLTLAVLVEKDFHCLAPDANRDPADDADAFPHPDEQHGCE